MLAREPRYPRAVATRSRSDRAAVLASSVQRSKPTPYPSKARSAVIRRTVVVVLVLAALALLTVSFRSPTAGALHDVQGAGASALRPFQVAATRVAQPFDLDAQRRHVRTVADDHQPLALAEAGGHGAHQQRMILDLGDAAHRADHPRLLGDPELGAQRGPRLAVGPEARSATSPAPPTSPR